jgi:hypothetical protein
MNVTVVRCAKTEREKLLSSIAEERTRKKKPTATQPSRIVKTLKCPTVIDNTNELDY